MKKNKKINFAFLGTPNLAVYVLEELAKENYLPSLVITAPDLKVGRGNNFEPTPVKKWAEKKKIPVLQPATLDESFIKKLREEKYDVFVLSAYGKILPKEILEIPKRGILNIHPSLLPKLRGSSPVVSAILNNERVTGVSIIVLDDKMDHGPIVAQEIIEEKNWPPLLPTFEEKLFRKGGKLLAKKLADYVDGKITPKPQDEKKATYSEKIKREDGLIDLLKDKAKDIYIKYCAFFGWPGIYFMQNGKRIKITEVKFEDENLVIKKVLPESKKEISYQDFLKQGRNLFEN